MTIGPSDISSAITALLATPDERPTAIELADRIKAMGVRDFARAIRAADALLGRPLSPKERVRGLQARAHARCYANDFDAAETDLAEAERLAAAHGLVEELGSIGIVRVQPLARRGRLEEAASAARSARAAFERAGDRAGAGKAGVNLGIVLRMQGRAAEAIEAFEVAQPALEGDPDASAAVQSNKAVALLELDRFAEAEGAFTAARARLSLDRQRHAAAIVEGNLADLAARMGRVDEALGRFASARELYERAGASADAARLTAEEGEALLTVGAGRRALRLLRGAIPKLESSGLSRELVRARLSLAAALTRQGALEEAEAELVRAARTAEETGAALLAAQANLARAELEAAAGRSDNARTHARAAAASLEGRPVRWASALATLGEVELRSGDPRAALELAIAARSAGEGEPVAPVLVRVAHLEARALAACGREEEALAGLRAAADAAERFRGAIRAELLRMSYLDTTSTLYHDLAELAMRVEREPARSSTVFDAIERLRNRSMLESLAGGERGGRGPTGGHAGAVLAELNALYAAGAGADAMSVRRRARIAELEDRLQHAGAGGTSSAVVAAPLPLAEVLGSIGADEAVVSFFDDGDGVSAQVLRRGRAELRRSIMPRSVLASLRRRVELEVDRVTCGLCDAEGSRLGEMAERVNRGLFGPLADLLAGVERLRIAPFGVLNHLPVAVGPGAPPGRVSLLPGVSVGARLGEWSSRVSGAGCVLVVGVPDAAAPRIEPEARAIAALHAGSTLLLGESARAEAVLGALPEAGVVHLACHAEFDAEVPMASRLRLSDRWVTARELTGRLRPGAVVVLGGCETGRTDMGGGENSLGFVHAVLASGAGCVLAARWPLHDVTAHDLLTRVHARAIESGKPGPAAFGEALDAEQRARAASGEPFVRWGGLYVIGGFG
jgi:tetratricopeptide (TPR) repeat protein